jgi:hypothetical protein
LKVYRGYDPNESTTLTQTAPVADGVVVLSGQVVRLQKNTQTGEQEWVLCTQGAAASGSTPYIALQDSADSDVVCTGLTGLSCSGDFELGTGFFDDAVYDVDDQLTVSATNAGNIAPAGPSQPLIGYVTRRYANAGGGNTDLTGKDSTADNLNIVVFTTNWSTPEVFIA